MATHLPGQVRDFACRNARALVALVNYLVTRYVQVHAATTLAVIVKPFPGGVYYTWKPACLLRGQFYLQLNEHY